MLPLFDVLTLIVALLRDSLNDERLILAYPVNAQLMPKNPS